MEYKIRFPAHDLELAAIVFTLEIGIICMKPCTAKNDDPFFVGRKLVGEKY